MDNAYTFHIKSAVAAVGIVFSVFVSFADVVTVSSVYDEATDGWIGNVTELTNALKNAKSGDTVLLQKGVYDLTEMSENETPMSTSGYGHALLSIGKSKLVGETGNAEDVVIRAVDSEYRLVNMSSGAEIHGVTLSGGNASSAHISGSSNYRSGGAVCFLADDCIVSNCIFTANKASVRGGAVAGRYNDVFGTVYDSVFYGNDDSTGESLVADRTTLRNCVISNNVATVSLDNYSTYLTTRCRIYDSVIVGNEARKGGVYGGCAVDCVFLSNRSRSNNWGNPGGGAARDSALTNCYFYGNSAQRLGGAIRGGTVVGCTVVSNRTVNLSNAYGGGIYQAKLVEDCVVVSNLCQTGGGVSSCTTVRDTEIKYNKAENGGGAYGSSLDGCTVEHNVATGYAAGNHAGAGGGMYEGSATNCVFRDNHCSATYNASMLKGCEIADNSFSATVIDSCVIHGLDNADIVRAVGNVAYPDGIVTSNLYMIGLGRTMRNCIVTNCHWKSLGGNHVNAAVFQPMSSGTTGRVENCTFADNRYYWFTRNYKTAGKALSMVNSVFSGNNVLNDRGDISGLDSGYMVFSNCVYSSIGDCTKRAAGFENSGCRVLETFRDAKYLGEGAHPLTPKRSSPLRGWGLTLDWMAEGKDLAGNPRLRDGKVDIGAYQCWLEPDGMMLLVR